MQLLNTGYQRAGKASRISIANGASFLAFASWNVDLAIDDLPTVNFESWNVAAQQTYDEGISGVLGAKFDCGGDWDAHLAPLATPPGLYPRDDGPRHQFITNRTDNVAWDFNSYTRIRTAKNGATVKDKVTFSYTGMSQGPFSNPATSV